MMPVAPLWRVQRRMRFLGWKGEETTGFSHKTDASGNTIARAHDEEWRRDYADAQAAEDKMLARERKAS